VIKEFFLDKFEYDYQCNKQWCEVMVNHEEELSPFILKSFSHILNVHHIWINRLFGKPSESFTWDVLPIDFWVKLAKENHLKTIDYLEKVELDTKVKYTSEEGVKLTKMDVDILFHILNHSNYHRAQISKELRALGFTPPSFNFISYK
jgi:uncharacterized damage-inducible protein DinB